MQKTTVNQHFLLPASYWFVAWLEYGGRCVPLKCGLTLSGLHNRIFQKTELIKNFGSYTSCCRLGSFLFEILTRNGPNSQANSSHGHLVVGHLVCVRVHVNLAVQCVIPIGAKDEKKMELNVVFITPLRC
jgi:hypothetical protein